MSKYTKYRLYQKYEEREGQSPIPCYPNIFSIDGDGTQTPYIVEENSRDCGYTGDTQPIYRWYTLPIDTYYYCDACQDAQYKWVNLPISQDWECVGTTKYYKQKKQVSVDGGSTWTDVTPPQYQRGALYEYSSQSCGYRTRTSSGSPYCDGYDKYVDVYSQYSTDGGNTWQTTATTPTMVEHNSEYCGYVPPSPTGYSGQYLTFIARESGTFKLSGNSVSYSLDSGQTWNTLASNTNSPTIQSGQKIMWKGNLVPNSNIGIGRFGSSGQFDVEGNAMSLLYGDNFENEINLSGKSNAFYQLFSGCTSLINAENLSLPATTLSNYCYDEMFRDCRGMITVPQLPATTLETNCYRAMYFDCKSLATIPTNYLSSTNIKEACYELMFAGCSSLTSTLTLPATTLAPKCYRWMFFYCTSLVTAPELPATTLANECYESMFQQCPSLVNAPVLSATTLVYHCYLGMFADCTSLSYIKCLATNISADGCTQDWVRDVSSSGTFVKASSMSSWTSGSGGIPSNWAVQNA